MIHSNTENRNSKKSKKIKFMDYLVVILFVIIIGVAFVLPLGHFEVYKNKNRPKTVESSVDGGLMTSSYDLSNILDSSEKLKVFETSASVDKCEKQWRSDRLVGKCFDLVVYSEYNQLKHIKIVESAVQCKSLCCSLGESCITWQYIIDSKTCKLGGPVRLGLEVMGTDLWCEPYPPVKWTGNKMKKQDTGYKCEWGEQLHTHCFGLGEERKGANESRLSASECADACCALKGCAMWQKMPDRGCFFSQKETLCDSYVGVYDGGRKCVPGFCGDETKNS